MIKKQAIVSVGIAGVMLAIALFRPAEYTAQTTFFVPLTLLEKQIQQNGIGFGSPTEVDAHIELMQSDKLRTEVLGAFGEGLDVDISKTRNGAVRVAVKGEDPVAVAQAANGAVALADSIKQSMLRQNVGMSFEVMQARTERLVEEESTLRKGLDSLRIEAQQDSLAFAALIFRKERQYGSVVVSLTQSERKLQDLQEYLEAPAPASYIISEAQEPTAPSGLPAVGVAALAGLIAFGVQRALSASKNA